MVEITLALIAFYATLWWFVSQYVVSSKYLILCSPLYGYFFAYTSRRIGSMAWSRFRQMKIWDIARAYFKHKIDDPHSIVRRAKGKAVIFALYPHGILPITLIFGFSLHGSAPQIADRVAVSPHFFRLPIIRELCLISGAIPATRRAMEEQIALGRSIIICPEGVRGVLHASNGLVGLDVRPVSDPRDWYSCCPGDERFYRWVFAAKLPVVPIFSEGEEHVFRTFPNVLRSMRERFIDKWEYCFPLVALGPYPAEITTHIGPSVGRANREETLSQFDARLARAIWIVLHNNTQSKSRTTAVNQWIEAMRGPFRRLF